MAENLKNDENKNNSVALEEGQETLLPSETAPTPEELQVGLAEDIKKTPLPALSKEEIAKAVGQFDLWDPTKSPAPRPEQVETQKLLDKAPPPPSPKQEEQTVFGQLPKPEQFIPVGKPKTKKPSLEETITMPGPPQETEAIVVGGSDKDRPDQETRAFTPEEIAEIQENTRDTIEITETDVQQATLEALGEKDNVFFFSPQEQDLLRQLAEAFPYQQEVTKGIQTEEADNLLWKVVQNKIDDISKEKTELTPDMQSVLVLLGKIHQEIREENKKKITEIINTRFQKPYTKIENAFIEELERYFLGSEIEARPIDLESVIDETLGEQGDEFRISPEYKQYQEILQEAQAAFQTKVNKILKNPFLHLSDESDERYIFEEGRKRIGAGGTGEAKSGFHAVVIKENEEPVIIPVIEKVVTNKKFAEIHKHEGNIMARIQQLLTEKKSLRKHFPQLIISDGIRIVMENLGNTNMQDFQKEVEELKPGEEKTQKTKILHTALADAIKATKWLHENDIIHKDIKPANIMISLDEKGEMRGVLIDFGVSAHKEDEKLQPKWLKEGRIMGTPGYFNIENGYQEDILDEKTDLFAFAVILLELRTDFSLADIITKVASSSTSESSAKVIRFMSNFEEYREILLKYAQEETDDRLKQIFKTVFAEKDDRVNIPRDNGWAEPTMKELEIITRPKEPETITHPNVTS